MPLVPRAAGAPTTKTKSPQVSGSVIYAAEVITRCSRGTSCDAAAPPAARQLGELLEALPANTTSPPTLQRTATSHSPPRFVGDGQA